MPSPVVLSTVPAEAFLAVLEFLYTNSVRLYRHSVSLLGKGVDERGRGGAGDTPFHIPTTHLAGAGGADRSCGIRAGGTARGGFMWQAPVSFLLLLTGSDHTLPHTYSGLERNVFQHRSMDISLCK